MWHSGASSKWSVTSMKIASRPRFLLLLIRHVLGSFTRFVSLYFNFDLFYISTPFNSQWKWNAATLYRYYSWLTLIKSKLYSNLNCLWSRRRRRRRCKRQYETKQQTDPINQQRNDGMYFWTMRQQMRREKTRTKKDKSTINTSVYHLVIKLAHVLTDHIWMDRETQKSSRNTKRDVNVLWCLNQIERIRAQWNCFNRKSSSIQLTIIINRVRAHTRTHHPTKSSCDEGK